MTVRFGRDPRYANRGRTLEELIELANDQYRTQGVAVIHKVPTAWIPIRNSAGRITSAKVEKKASVDFLGNYRGRPIAFDAKHTGDLRIRWDRVEPHQAEFLTNWDMQPGSMAFVLVEFGDLSCSVIPWREWRRGLENWEHGAPGVAASVSRDDPIMVLGRVGQGQRFPVVLDYLWTVDRLWRVEQSATAAPGVRVLDEESEERYGNRARAIKQVELLEVSQVPGAAERR